MTTMTMTASVECAPFDDKAARREGWLIAGCGTDDAGRRRVELQRLDEPQDGENTFPNDGDAWKHVAKWARRGSPLHMQALTRVDPIERALIERHANR